MIRLYLFVYAILVVALWWLCPLIPDGVLKDVYSYSRLALHVFGPVWIASRPRVDPVTADDALNVVERLLTHRP